ncbi:MAG: OmpA family protein [Nitrospinota bacterium]
MLTSVKVAWGATAVLAAALAVGGYQYASRFASDAEQASGLKSRLRTLEERERALAERLKGARADIARLEGQRAETAASLEDRRKEASRLKADLDKTAASLADSRKELRGARGQLDQARAEVSRLKAELGKASASLADSRKELREARGRLDRARRENARLLASLRDADRYLSEFRADLARAERRIDELGSREVSATEVVASLRSENEKLRRELDAFSGKVRRLDRAGLEAQATRRSLAEKISALRRELEEATRRKEREIAELKASRRLLMEKLKSRIEKKEVALGGKREYISIRMMDRVLFETGSAELTERSRRTLDKIYAGLAPIKDGLVMIEGHADDRKIHGALRGRFPSNWELSLARASAVVRYLQSKGMDPKRLSVIGFSYYRPVDTNLTAVGRSRNRRVEIKLIPPGFSPAAAPALTKQ